MERRVTGKNFRTVDVLMKECRILVVYTPLLLREERFVYKNQVEDGGPK